MKQRTWGQIVAKQRHDRKIRYWLGWYGWIPAGLTMIVALLAAIGILPANWNAWITFAVAVMAFLGLLMTSRPEKSAKDKALENLLDTQRKAKRS